MLWAGQQWALWKQAHAGRQAEAQQHKHCTINMTAAPQLVCLLSLLAEGSCEQGAAPVNKAIMAVATPCSSVAIQGVPQRLDTLARKGGSRWVRATAAMMRLTANMPTSVPAGQQQLLVSITTASASTA
jgi:hypothetical protein